MYRDCASINNGVVNADAFFTLCTENGFYIKFIDEPLAEDRKFINDELHVNINSNACKILKMLSEPEIIVITKNICLNF